ncbi:MAG: patatin [Gammaproteobacteria bacterium]|nr:patatin [Gammaproteobacteria bacterium]
MYTGEHPIRRLDLMRLVSLSLVAVVLAGCGSVPERHPLTQELQDVAVIPGIPGARDWGDGTPGEFAEWFDLSREEVRALYPRSFDESHNYLALSGGGSRGAFAAGLLSGWTAAGTRPSFTIVTGVSTGAIIAPFAFLGPKYDHVLKDVYTTMSTDDAFEMRSLLETLTSDAGADTTPMRARIEAVVTDDVVAAIAAEYRKGRLLLIGTTNLDAARPVTWNITRIASSGAPNVRQLIIDIIMASAAIPGAFPPVLLDVEANGQRYDEMHVDGSATTSVFFYPLQLDWGEVMDANEVDGKPNLYVIRNGQLREKWMSVEPKTLTITLRAVNTLITAGVGGDMYRMYLAARRDGLNYHLAYIPSSFDAEEKELFDPAYMTELFELGYEMAKDGYDWQPAPPDFEIDSD